MTDISLPRVGELIRAVFEYLWHKPDGVPAKEVLAFVPEFIVLTEDEKRVSPINNIPKYERIIRLATVPLTRVGWLTKNNKGRWRITEQGRRACRRFSNAQDLYREALRIFEEYNQHTPEITMVFESAQEKAWEQIQRYLQGTKIDEFRVLTGDLLIAMGYHVGWIANSEKHHRQIDMLAYIDPIGARGIRIVIQITHKGQAFTFEGLKSFQALLSPNDYGLLISTGGFTNDVRDEIKGQGYENIHALDLEAFYDLWILHYEALSQDARNRLPLKSVSFLVPLN